MGGVGDVGGRGVDCGSERCLGGMRGWCLMMGAVGGYSARVGVGSEKVKKV